MQTQRGKRKHGFTLVELLVVIVIIAILAGLATPAIMIAFRKVKVTAMALEVNNLAQGIEVYRNRYGEYPPDFSDKRAVIRHLDRIFPRRQEVRNLTELQDTFINKWGLRGPDDNGGLFPDQALVFWLRGFFKDQEFPISGDRDNDGTPDSERDAIIHVDEKMIAIWDTNPSYNPNNPQTWVAYDDLNLDTPGEVFVSSRQSGDNVSLGGTNKAPLVYFDSRNLSTCNNCTESYEVMADIPKTYRRASHAQGTAVPYASSTTKKYVKPDSFQIICAGLDGHFGDFEIGDPLKWHGTGDNFDRNGFDDDNLANFTDKPLGDSIE